MIRWITTGPEVSRIIDEFETPPVTKGIQHQETSIYALFARHVRAMVDTFEESGNPFNEDSQDLIALDSTEVTGDTAVGSLRDDMETIGQSQYEKYIDERLKPRSTPISNIIPRNNVSPFKKTPQTKQSRTSH